MIPKLQRNWRWAVCLSGVGLGLALLYLGAFNAFGQIPPPGGGLTITVQFASGIGYPTPQGSTMNVGVSLNFASQQDVSVGYATTYSGTAVSGVDYVPTSGTVTIPAGSTMATFPVQTLDDPGGPQTSTVGLVLVGPSGGATLGDPSTSTLNLLNMETCPPQ